MSSLVAWLNISNNNTPQLKYFFSTSTLVVFHLLIQTSVTSFLALIPVTLIFFFFINFFFI